RDIVRQVADTLVTANQVGVRIDQDDVASREPSRPMQIEEDGAASEERLDVPAEFTRIETADLGKELALAASPLQQWANPVIGYSGNWVIDWRIESPILQSDHQITAIINYPLMRRDPE